MNCCRQQRLTRMCWKSDINYKKLWACWRLWTNRWTCLSSAPSWPMFTFTWALLSWDSMRPGRWTPSSWPYTSTTMENHRRTLKACSLTLPGKRHFKGVLEKWESLNYYILYACYVSKFYDRMDILLSFFAIYKSLRSRNIFDLITLWSIQVWVLQMYHRHGVLPVVSQREPPPGPQCPCTAWPTGHSGDQSDGPTAGRSLCKIMSQLDSNTCTKWCKCINFASYSLKKNISLVFMAFIQLTYFAKLFT